LTPAEAQIRVQSELHVGENLVWSGVPDARRAVLFANRRRGSMLLRCRGLLGADDSATDPEITAQLHCPVCSGPMLVVERMTSSQLRFRSGLIPPDPQRRSLDSS